MPERVRVADESIDRTESVLAPVEHALHKVAVGDRAGDHRSLSAGIDHERVAASSTARGSMSLSNNEPPLLPSSMAWPRPRPPPAPAMTTARSWKSCAIHVLL